MQSYGYPLPRFPVAMVLGAATTVVLFLIMNDLVRQNRTVPEVVRTLPITDIYRRIEDVPVKPPEELKPPPELEVPPPTHIETVMDPFDGDFGIVLTPPPADDGPAVPGQGPVDGEILPIVKVAPVYPNRARTRGIEGFVLVSFTVDEKGRVQDPKVLDAQPRGVFERVALDAVRKFKYRPRVLNGQAMRVEEVLHRVSFELKGS